ncbi:MAG: carboxymuconolactone decarboxylase family protein [Patulibacter sp.]|nr:carboxymuconolactone decarboxylase family protein [Patulibacter sp.]
MARLQGVQDGEGGLFARYAFRESRRRTGKVMTALRIGLLHPGITVGVGAMERQLDRAKDVDPVLTELASLKAATLIGCEFCIDIGSFLARTQHGATEEQIRDLHRHRESPAFDARQRLVLDYAEAMSQTPVRVDDRLFDTLREQFDPKQLVALTSAIAWEQYRARFNGALDIGPDGFTEGGVCAIQIAGAETAPVAATT